MQKLLLRSERDRGAASSAEKTARQKDSRRSHSVDSDHLLRAKSKSKANKPASRKSTKVEFLCRAAMSTGLRLCKNRFPRHCEPALVFMIISDISFSALTLLIGC